MAGGAGSVGGSGGMGQQPMGNASALPYNPTGGGFGPAPNNFAPQTQSGNYSQAFGGGSPFGMQQQQPYGMQPMQNPFAGQNPYINSMPGPSWAGGYLGQQQMGRQQDSRSMGYEVGEQMGQLGAPNQMAQPMPQQPQRPAYMDNPDFQAYQKQEQDLGRQMNEYMQKAPMYQQLQDLQGKMRGFQQPQGQMGMPPPNVAQGTVGIGNFEQDQLDRAFGRSPRMDNRMGMPRYGGRGGFGGRMGGYGGGYGGQMGQAGLMALMQGQPRQSPIDPRMLQELM